MYDEVGGSAFFVKLVDRFYEGVAGDDVLMPLYPDGSDLTGAKERLSLFLMQYWGGPTTYSDARGHPRLRQRHFPFTIGERERDHWLAHMLAAVDQVCREGNHEPSVHERLVEYMTNAAQHMVNAETNS
jgi:hemoglobin